VLLESIPIPDPEIVVTGTTITGEPPSPVNPPAGCRFHPRCPYADDVCASTEPVMREIDADHFVACHHPLQTHVSIS
jgi:peptide/nickel transport system ATP-binding protein